MADNGGQFQSTPPRGGRHPGRHVSYHSINVSIHAPTRGATLILRTFGFRRSLFQSTPPRGGRRMTRFLPQAVSAGFNPRPHAGGDFAQLVTTSALLQFQSTPPRGGRRSAVCRSSRLRRFNPRPHAGGDTGLKVIGVKPMVSIHAPTRGATRAAVREAIEIRFQSTPPRGGRPQDLRESGGLRCFNPRPHAGGDESNNKFEQCARDVSIHAPTRGATWAPEPKAPKAKFQSTPPRGGRPH